MIIPYYEDSLEKPKDIILPAYLINNETHHLEYFCDDLPENCRLHNESGSLIFLYNKGLPDKTTIKVKAYNMLGFSPHYINDEEITIYWLKLRRLTVDRKYTEYYTEWVNGPIGESCKLYCEAQGSCITRLRLHDNKVYADYTQTYNQFGDYNEDGVYDDYITRINPYEWQLPDGTYGWDNYNEAGPYTWVDDTLDPSDPEYGKEYTFNLSFPEKNIHKLYTKEYSFPIDESELIGKSITSDDCRSYGPLYEWVYTVS
jgi:hypothetical protein